MNRPGHVLNAVLLSIGLGYLLEPVGFEVVADGLDTAALATTYWVIVEVGVPVTLGALFPDIDCAFGTHRKTFHNLPVLGAFVAFPLVFGNLQYVWIGVLTHYVLDTMGTVRGMAYFYPWPEEYDLPIVAPLSRVSTTAAVVVVTAIELAVAGVLLHLVPAETYATLSRLVGL